MLISISVHLHAQHAKTRNNTDKTFEMPAGNVQARLLIDLGNGNKMQLECNNYYLLDNMPDMDSILQLFIHDIEPLKDSLKDELSTKRIDYVIEPSGRMKIRLQQFSPKGSSFVTDKGELAALKLEPDTINFLGTRALKVKTGMVKPGYNYRVSIYINRISELPGLAGKLDDKMERLKKSENAKWRSDKNEVWHPKSDPSISANAPDGHLAGTGDYLNSIFSVHLQNYKNYFVPSFSMGLNAVATNVLKCSIGLYWEPQFLFQNNSGKLQTYRNDFLTLVVGQRALKSIGSNQTLTIFGNISVGYLIRRKGEFYDKGTFRIGLDSRTILGGKVGIEPLFYFHDIFKNVTPGLRIKLNF
jgi:hypothetical protein